MTKVTLFKGDGVGPEISKSVVKILEAMDLGLKFEVFEAGQQLYDKEGILLSEESLESVRRNKVALKAPLTTPIGSGFRSINVQMRMALDLYANIRPSKTHPELDNRFQDVDIVIFRENTEDLYVGEEEMISDDEAIAIKRITRKNSERIIRMAYEYAVKYDRKRVTCVHKANILKYTDGLFRKVFNEVKEEYPNIKSDDLIIDNVCMQLVMWPEEFDVMVMPNLYGDIVSDITSGLIGGVGIAPSLNRNDEIATFEAIHGTAPDIAGKGIANPSALLLSACLMLDFLNMHEPADKIRAALGEVMKQPELCTPDLGGKATTDEFTDTLISYLVD